MVKLFGRNKVENPANGYGVGEWEWWEKEDTHIFRRALSLGSASTGEYHGEWMDGKPNGQGVLELRAGQRFEGTWKNGLPNGHGKCNYPDGSVYEGEFHDGNPDGEGSRRWADGSTEAGTFSHGKLHGKGKTVNDEKDVFEGHFAHGVPNGAGEFLFAEGDWFRGLVDKGLPLEGDCLQTIQADGQFGDAFFEYRGPVKGGAWNGKGKLTLFEKRSATKAKLDQYRLYTYDGHFRDGKFHGHGKKVQLRDNDGGDGSGGGGWEYDGEWKEDNMTGQGKLTYQSGATFEGSFRNGKPHGACSFKAADGQYKQGTWVRGKLSEGVGKLLWQDGRFYEGGMVDGEMDGEGVMQWANGDRIQGRFEQGLFPQHGLLLTGRGNKRNVKLDEGFLHNVQGRRAEGGVLPNYLDAPDAS